MRKRIAVWTAFILALVVLGAAAASVTPFSIIDFIGQAVSPTNPTGGKGRVFFSTSDSQLHCLTSLGANCLSGAGGGGTVTNIATTGPITGGPITSTGTIACATCETSAGIAANAVVKSSGGQVAIASTISDGGGGVQIGTPTGGAQGAGTLNVAGGIFSNGSAVPIGCQSGCAYSPGNSDYPIAFGSVTSLMTANNTPQFIRFNNTTTKKLGNAIVKTGTASAGGHFSIGVYSVNGTALTLIWSTGSQSTASGNTQIPVTPTAVQLQAGTSYYIAWCADNTTATVAGPTNSGAAGVFGAAGAANTFGVNATDVCTAGVLPSTATSTNITNNSNATMAGIYATN